MQRLAAEHPRAALYFGCADFTGVYGLEGGEDTFGWELYFYLSLGGRVNEAVMASRLDIHTYDVGDIL